MVNEQCSPSIICVTAGKHAHPLFNSEKPVKRAILDTTTTGWAKDRSYTGLAVRVPWKIFRSPGPLYSYEVTRFHTRRCQGKPWFCLSLPPFFQSSIVLDKLGRTLMAHDPTKCAASDVLCGFVNVDSSVHTGSTPSVRFSSSEAIFRWVPYSCTAFVRICTCLGLIDTAVDRNKLAQ